MIPILAILVTTVFAIIEQPYTFCYLLRWWWWGGERGGALALMLWLHHALPDSFLEGSVCLRSTYGVLEWLGLLLCLHHADWGPNCCYWRFGISLRLYSRPEGLSHSCGVCGPGHICAGWVFICVSNVLPIACSWLVRDNIQSSGHYQKINQSWAPRSESNIQVLHTVLLKCYCCFQNLF